MRIKMKYRWDKHDIEVKMYKNYYEVLESTKTTDLKDLFELLDDVAGQLKHEDRKGACIKYCKDLKDELVMFVSNNRGRLNENLRDDMIYYNLLGMREMEDNRQEFRPNTTAKAELYAKFKY